MSVIVEALGNNPVTIITKANHFTDKDGNKYCIECDCRGFRE